MALHRLTAGAAAGVLVLGLAGCGGDPKPSASSGTPTRTPSVSPTGPVAPVLPDLAKRHDDVGAKAFVKYWFAAVTYAMHTGDTDPFMAASAKECKTCTDLEKKIAKVYGDGGRTIGGDWSVAGIDDGTTRSDGMRVYRVFIEQARRTLVNSAGHRLAVAEQSGFGAEVLVRWAGTSHGWITREVAKVG